MLCFLSIADIAFTLHLNFLPVIQLNSLAQPQLLVYSDPNLNLNGFGLILYVVLAQSSLTNSTNMLKYY